ncbi:MAG: hypothetical protein OXF20_09190 [Gammaproteobacteria bacterium]|nr:hypothetical protein [Gammaproteobacteria bacterium]
MKFSIRNQTALPALPRRFEQPFEGSTHCRRWTRPGLLLLKCAACQRLTVLVILNLQPVRARAGPVERAPPREVQSAAVRKQALAARNCRRREIQDQRMPSSCLPATETQSPGSLAILRVDRPPDNRMLTRHRPARAGWRQLLRMTVLHGC